MEKIEHKKISKINERFFLSKLLSRKGQSGASYKIALENTGKLRHKLSGNMTIEQNNRTQKIKLFVLTDIQFLKWEAELRYKHPSMFTQLSKENIMDPEEYLYSTKDAVTSCDFDIPINDENSIYFILDNGFSYFTEKYGHLSVFEEWDELITLDQTIRKFVNAREAIDAAKKCFDEKPEDVSVHLRQAIELAIKEKFHFSISQGMKKFFDDADKYNLKLPGYSLIYASYNAGSSRMHSGIGSTKLESKHMINIVTDFVDELERMDISQEKIDEFKSRSNTVK